MSFLSVLGKIGKGIGKVGASLIPGGSLAMDALGAIGDVAGAGAGGAQKDRMSEAELQMLMNQGNNRASLEAGTFNAGQQSNLIKRALAAQMLQDRQAPTDPRIAKFYGGPSDATKALAQKYGSMADQDVMSGAYKLTPTMSNIPKSGAMEKMLGGVGMGAGILSALGKIGGGAGKPGVDQVGGGMGGSTGAPNLPYQPLPRADMTIPSEQWAGAMPMPSGDPKSLHERLRKAGSTPPIFPPLSGVNF